MSTPTLGLGISAPGVSEMERLAASLKAVRTELSLLAALGKGNELGGLTALEDKVTSMKKSLKEDFDNFRKEVAASAQQAFAGVAQATALGADKAATATQVAAQRVMEADAKAVKAIAEGREKGAATLRVSGQRVSFGGGLFGSVSGKGLESLSNVQNLQSMLATNARVLRAGRDQELSELLAALDKSEKATLAKLSDTARKLMKQDAEIAATRAANQNKAIFDQLTGLDRAISGWRVRSASSMGEDDTRALLGMPSRDSMKTFAADLRRSMEEVQRIRESAAQPTKYAYSNLLTREVVNSSDLKKFASALKDVDLDTHTKSAEKARLTTGLFAQELNNAHSAARGLASGFGAMWLTWGNIAPLLAGAALSHSFVQTIKMGAEVQQSLAAIRVLGGATAGEVAQLESQMLALGRNGPFGPVELAKAMKTLSLAGLDAKDVFKALPDVLNFAVAGDTGVEKAADVMTTVATAFNTTAASYSYIADTISVAAAESKSSVESMGEAFKTASVVHKQYGVSLEDTAVGLALLANAGIQGSAAGTALRNMYADLSGRTPKVTKAMEELGLKVRNNNGLMKDQAVIFTDLVKALSQRTPTAQADFISAIFSERGGKEAIAIIDALRSKATATGVEVTNVYEKLADAVTNAAGFAAIAAAEMSLTPLNQMRSVGTALQSTLVSVFNDLQPQVISMSMELKRLFNTDEFRKFVSDLVQGVGTVLTTLLEWGRALATGVIAWMSFRAAIVVTGAVAAAFTVQAAAATAGILSMTAASAAMAAVNPILAGITAAVSLGASAWAMYKLYADDGRKANQPFVGDSSAAALLDRLLKEKERLEAINTAREKNITLQEQEAAIAVSKARSSLTPEQADARNALADFDSKNNGNLVGMEAMRNVNIEKRKKLVEAVNLADQRHAMMMVGLEQTMVDIKIAGSKIAEAERKKQKAAQDAIPRGTLGVPPKVKTLHSLTADPDFSTIKSLYATMAAESKRLYEDERQILETRHKGNLVSEGQYLAQMLSLTLAYEANELEHIRQTTEAASRESAQRYVQAYRELGGKDQAEDLKKALEKLGAEWTKFEQQQKSAAALIESGAMKRLTISTLQAESALKKLLETNAEYWAKSKDEAKQALAAAEAEGLLFEKTERQIAVDTAIAQAKNAHGAELRKLNQEYQKANKSMDDLSEAYRGEIVISPEVSKAFETQATAVAALSKALGIAQADLEDLIASAAKTADIKFTNKEQEKLRTQYKDLSKDIGSKLADAILAGGREGADSLRDWIKDYFVKQPIKVVVEAFLKPVSDQLAGFVMGMPTGGSGTGSGSGSLPWGGPDFWSSGGSDGLGWAERLGHRLYGNGTGPTSGIGEWMVGNSGAVQTGGNVLGYLSAMNSASNGKWGTAAGSAIGTYFGGPIGSMVGSQIGSMVDSLFGGGGGPKEETGYGYGINSTEQYGGAAIGLVNSAQQSYLGLANKLGARNVQGLQAGYFYSTDPQGDSMTQLQVAGSLGGQQVYTRGDRLGGIENVGRSDAELQAALKEETARLLVAALKASDIKARYKEYLGQFDTNASSGDELQKALDTVSVVAELEAAFSSLSSNIGQLVNSSMEGSFALAELFGGVSSLVSGVNAYYDNFYTVDERNRMKASALSKTMADLGYASVDTADEFRLLVEGIDLSTEAGRSLYKTLIELAPGFAEVHGSAEKVAADAKAAKERAANERLGLDRELYALTKDETLLKQIREAELKTLDPLNQEYRKRIWLLQDEKEKAEAAAAAAEKYSASLSEAREFLANITTNIGAYVNKLNTTGAGLLTPQQQLTNAAAAYQQQLALARSGNRDALSNITGYADTYIEANKAYSGSGGATVSVIEMIKQQLTALPTLVSPEQLIVDAVNSSGTTVANAVNSSSTFLSSALASRLDNGFGRMDTTLDGLLTPAEFLAGMAGSATDATLRTIFTSIDTNGDGVISRIEATNSILNTTRGALVDQLVAGFTKLDSTADGLLTPAEFLAGYAGTASEATLRGLFTITDANGDGVINRLEANNAAILTMQGALVSKLDFGFGKLDTTADGLLTPAEFLAGMAGSATETSLRALFVLTDTNADGFISRMEANNAAVGQLQVAVTTSLVQGFEKLDTSGDKLLSIDEFKAGMVGKASEGTLAAMFTALDANGDGQLSQLELTRQTLAAGLSEAQYQSIQLEAIAFQQTQLDAIWQRAGGILDAAWWINNSLTGVQYNQSWQSVQLDMIWQRLGGVLTVRSMNQSGSPMFFARGAMFDQGVISRPTMFNPGMMGEAGKEVIAPLVDGPYGIGIRNYGGGSSDSGAVVAELRSLERRLASIERNTGESQQPLTVVVVTPDGKEVSREVLADLWKLSRSGKVVIDSRGIAKS